MKKIKALMASMLAAVTIGVSSTAFAENYCQSNQGSLDGAWFKTRIKTAVKQYHAIHVRWDQPYGFNGSTIKFDSGNNQCYSVSDWSGDLSFTYALHTFCKGTGAWEYEGYVGLDELWYGSAGTIIGNYSRGIFVPAEGKSYYAPVTEGSFHMGSLILKPNCDASGKVKSVNLIQPEGTTVYFKDDADGWGGYEGSAPSGLSMKQVNIDKVPAGVQDCLASVLGEIPPLRNCESYAP